MHRGNQFSLSFQGVTLVALNPEQSVPEEDLGNSTTAASCFEASLEQPLNRIAVFLLIQSISSTATNGLDFFPVAPVITVPGDFVGEFVTCANFTIIGDNLIEDNETIVFDVVPQVAIDRVQFPENTSSVIVNILDNDGK